MQAEAPAAPVVERPTFAATPPPQPIGSLSVKEITEERTTAPDEEASTAATSAALDAMKLLSKPGSKKASASKKSSVKKLSTNSDYDVSIESFESVDRRAVKAAQEEEDRKMAVKLSREINSSENESSGRVAAMMMEAEAGAASPAKPSIYRSAPSTTSSAAPSTVFTGSGRYGNLGMSSAAGSASAAGSGAESREARERYGNAKGISSDNYFGRDDDSNAARSNLQNYSSSKAISSDMLRGGDSYSYSANNDTSLDRLKDSVSGFFDSIGGKR